jgi:hypothetical protein
MPTGSAPLAAGKPPDSFVNFLGSLYLFRRSLLVFSGPIQLQVGAPFGNHQRRNAQICSGRSPTTCRSLNRANRSRNFASHTRGQCLHLEATSRLFAHGGQHAQPLNTRQNENDSNFDLGIRLSLPHCDILHPLSLPPRIGPSWRCHWRSTGVTRNCRQLTVAMQKRLSPKAKRAFQQPRAEIKEVSLPRAYECLCCRRQFV